MLRVEAVGDAPIEKVWRRYTEPDLWAFWAPQIRKVTSTGEAGRPIRPGDRGRVLGPAGIRVPFLILAVDDQDRTWRWRVGLRRLSVTMDHGVEDNHGSTRAWVRIHLPGPVAWPYAPVARLALTRLVDADS